MNIDLSSSFIISTASGKGGVGKTMVTVNLAESLRHNGHSVALIDADLGLSNCAALLNEQVSATALDVFRKQSYLSDLFQTTTSGITLVTGADERDINIGDWELLFPVLDEIIRKLQTNHDFILIDTPAGASKLNLWALDRSDLCTLILANEPTVISDAYRFCKYIMNIDPVYPFATIVNFAENEKEAQSTATRFNSILNHFLDRELPYLGYISSSKKIRDSIRRQQPVTHLYPDSKTTNEFEYISRILTASHRAGYDSLSRPSEIPMETSK